MIAVMQHWRRGIDFILFTQYCLKCVGISDVHLVCSSGSNGTLEEADVQH